MLLSLTAIFLIRRKIACDCGRWALYGFVSSVLDAAREALPRRHQNMPLDFWFLFTCYLSLISGFFFWCKKALRSEGFGCKLLKIDF